MNIREIVDKKEEMEKIYGDLSKNEALKENSVMHQLEELIPLFTEKRDYLDMNIEDLINYHNTVEGAYTDFLVFEASQEKSNIPTFYFSGDFLKDDVMNLILDGKREKADIVKFSGYNPYTIQKIAENLKEEGLIKFSRSGKKRVYVPTEKVRKEYNAKEPQKDLLSKDYTVEMPILKFDISKGKEEPSSLEESLTEKKLIEATPLEAKEPQKYNILKPEQHFGLKREGLHFGIKFAYDMYCKTFENCNSEQRRILNKEMGKLLRLNKNNRIDLESIKRFHEIHSSIRRDVM